VSPSQYKPLQTHSETTLIETIYDRWTHEKTFWCNLQQAHVKVNNQRNFFWVERFYCKHSETKSLSLRHQTRSQSIRDNSYEAQLNNKHRLPRWTQQRPELSLVQNKQTSLWSNPPSDAGSRHRSRAGKLPPVGCMQSVQSTCSCLHTAQLWQ